MYVCICNGITDSQVKWAFDTGIRNWNDVHTKLGCKPNCGKCECEILLLAEEYKISKDTSLSRVETS